MVADPERRSGGILGRWRNARAARPWLAWAAVVLVAALVLIPGTGALVEVTNRDAFCLSCHELRPAFEEFTHSPHYLAEGGASVRCADCHLPPDYPDRLLAKVGRLKDVVAHVKGTIDTPQKYEERRLPMARAVWQRLAANDSAPCRSCHLPGDLAAADAPQAALEAHERAGRTGETCIHCHRGVAHRVPEEPLPPAAQPAGPDQAVACGGCHEDPAAFLPGTCTETPGMSLETCLGCHDPRARAVEEPDPYFTGLHARHIGRVGCDGCHRWTPESGLAVLGHDGPVHELSGHGWERVRESTLAWATQRHLSRAHGREQLGCAACHAHRLEPEEDATALNARCESCHGDLPELADRALAERRVDSSHRSHLLDLQCTDCHAGHSPSEVYCHLCHTTPPPSPGLAQRPAVGSSEGGRVDLAMAAMGTELSPQP